MLKIKEEISVSDILNTAKYKMMLAKEKEKADPEYAANLEYQAEEYHKLAHEITRTAARNSLNIDISKMIGNTGNYLSLTYDILKKDAKQLRLNLTDPTDINNDKDIKKLAQNTPDNKKEKEKLSKDISHENLKEKAEQTGRDIRDVQMQLLNKNKKDNKIKPSDIPAKVPNDQKEFHRKLAQDKYDMYHYGTCKNISLDHIIRDANGLPND